MRPCTAGWFQRKRCTRWSSSRGIGPAWHKPEMSSFSADARAESPLESRSRVRMDEVGLPQPELQVEILDQAGRFSGRAAFCCPRHRTLGEVDGKVKYASGDPKILFDEKLRRMLFGTKGESASA